MEVRGGLIVLHLRGGPYARGLAHGRLLRREIRRSGIAPYFAAFLSDLVSHSPHSRRMPGSVRRGLTRLLEWWFYSPLESLMLEETREEVQGVADGAGMDRRTVFRAALAPDLMEHLAAAFLKPLRDAAGRAGPGGCSGVYARGAALAGPAGALLARNMDFPGALVWRYPVVIFSHPDEEIDVIRETRPGVFGTARRRKAPYVYVSVAGFPGHGLTGMSAHGIAVASFVCMSRSVSRRGQLSLDYNHWLLTRAESIGGIRHLAGTGRQRSASPHVALFAGAEEALAVEADASGSAVREMAEGTDTLVQTNHFLDPRRQRWQMEYPLEREHTLGRFRLLEEALAAERGRLDAQRMVDILSANLDRTSGTTRLLGDFPAQLTTLSSAVFAPATGDFWVAAGQPPAVCYGEYAGFNLHRELSGAAGAPGPEGPPPLRRSDRPVLPGAACTPFDEAAREALRLLARSQERLKAGRPQAALRGVERAWALTDDPGCELLLALLCLSAGRPAKALGLLRELRARRIFPPVKAAALALWEGRCLDILGRRGEARACYRALLGEPGLPAELRSAAGRSLRRRFRVRMLPASFDYSLLGPLVFS